jgi:hypothetical protein
VALYRERRRLPVDAIVVHELGREAFPSSLLQCLYVLCLLGWQNVGCAFAMGLVVLRVVPFLRKAARVNANQRRLARSARWLPYLTLSVVASDAGECRSAC